MELAAKRGVPAVETIVARYDVYNADECFLTGTAAEVIPVVELDGRSIGTGKPGPITGQLMADFRVLVRSEGVPVYTDEERAARQGKNDSAGGSCSA
jgi:branched-chain amino acid aminotransferase